MPTLAPELLAALDEVSSTALITLFARARQSRATPPLIEDPEAARLADLLLPALLRSAHPMHRKVARGRVPRLAQAMVTLRARHFDAKALDFLARHPGARVVNLACGFDTRFHRLQRAGAADLRVIDLDLPQLITLKAGLVAPAEGYSLVAADVTEPAWLEDLAAQDAAPAIFLAEGLFMYLDEEAVKQLVVRIRDLLPGSELIAEVFNARWLRPPWGPLVQAKLRQRFGFRQGAAFRSGIDAAQDMAAWGPGIRVIDEWSSFDEEDPSLGAFRVAGRLDLFRRTQWVVALRLG